MHDHLKLLGLASIFGAAGAAATVSMWQVFDIALWAFTPPPYTVLGCFISGLIGPLAVATVVFLATRMKSALRWPAGLGLGMVLATELAFYLPLGFMAVAFHAS